MGKVKQYQLLAQNPTCTFKVMKSNTVVFHYLRVKSPATFMSYGTLLKNTFPPNLLPQKKKKYMNVLNFNVSLVHNIF
jgi:hypothetical protein